MAHLISPLMVLLSLLGANNGQQQFGSCDYLQEMVPGNKYYVYNTNYPQKYPAGSNCRWVARSDSPINLTCNPFNIPASTQCSQDALIVQDGAETTGHRYCGEGTLNIVSKSNELTITLTAPRNSNGGTFLCTLESKAPEDDDINCRCGWKNPTRIIGGEETGINEYPMMAGLVDATQSMLFCGSTIINNKQVLTAAHCVFNRNVNDIGVLVGDHDLSTGADTNATRLFRSAFFHIHELYNPQSDDYDLALVEIVGTIQFSQEVGPACLPFQHWPDTFGGSFVEVLGWGSTEFAGGPSNTLQKAQLSVITNAQCVSTYQDLTTRQLCTYADDKDSCQFDSGGPVLWQNPTTRRIVEIGIISLGSICADGTPAINTKVGSYISWIESKKPEGFNYCKAE